MAFAKFSEFLRTQGVDPEEVTNICIDLSPAFISGINSYFSNARITFDKFHVVKITNETLNEIRKSLIEIYSKLKGTIYLIGSKEKKLTRKQIGRKRKLMKIPEIEKVVTLAEGIDEIWESTEMGEVLAKIDIWIERLQPIFRTLTTSI